MASVSKQYMAETINIPPSTSADAISAGTATRNSAEFSGIRRTVSTDGFGADRLSVIHEADTVTAAAKTARRAGFISCFHCVVCGVGVIFSLDLSGQTG